MTFDIFEGLPQEKQQLIINKGIAVFADYSYVDARTDMIAEKADISKGLLFYYFDSKKRLYLYLLDYAVKRLTQNTIDSRQYRSFYDIIFASMDKKYSLVAAYPNEMKFINMAAKETHQQISQETQRLLAVYRRDSQKKSRYIMSEAVAALPLKTHINSQKLTEALILYTEAIVASYFKSYQDNPQELFNNFDSFKTDIKDYLDLMLYGAVKVEREK